MAAFVTSDSHFGHDNIIRFCKRPFSSVSEMDEAMIDAWNQAVSPRDVVWHLGDFAYWRAGNGKDGGKERAQKILRKLNGQKNLIRGNHDIKGLDQLEGWNTVRDILIHKIEGQKVVLAHYPMLTWPGKPSRRVIHLYGHTHGKLPGTSLSCDVGVDAFGFRPVRLEAVMARMAQMKDYPFAADADIETADEADEPQAGTCAAC